MAHTLEIHHISSGGGDCIAILVKDGAGIKKNVLIDAGGQGKSEHIAKYISTYKVGTGKNNKKFDYFIATHYHQDHVLGLVNCAIEPSNVIDIGGYTINSVNFEPAHHVASSKRFYANYKKYLKDRMSDTEDPLKRCSVGFMEKNPTTNKHGKIILNESPEIILHIVAGAGVVADLGMDKKKSTFKDVIDYQEKFGKTTAIMSENDLSIVCVLQWGDFLYYAGGDSTGDPDLKAAFNIEKYILEALKSGGLTPISVVKASHHGSAHCNLGSDIKGEDFFSILSPTCMIVQCNKSLGVPHHDFLVRAGKYFDNAGGDVRKSLLFGNKLKFRNISDKSDEIIKTIGQKYNHNLSYATDENGKMLKETISNGNVGSIIVMVSEDIRISNSTVRDLSDMIIADYGQWKVIVRKYLEIDDASDNKYDQKVSFNLMPYEIGNYTLDDFYRYVADSLRNLNDTKKINALYYLPYMNIDDMNSSPSAGNDTIINKIKYMQMSTYSEVKDNNNNVI